jgi:4-hydroxybenzoyl-CoA thioesterase
MSDAPTPAPLDPAHIIEMTVPWGHCDPAGIVFHPRYFEWFDGAAAEIFAQVTGMTKPAMLAHYGAAGIPVVKTGANFLLPCRFGDAVRVETRVSAFRRSAFDMQHRVLLGGQMAVEGWSTRVWTGWDKQDPTRLKSQKLPDDLVSRFKPRSAP